jgi:hypothetical protein
MEDREILDCIRALVAQQRRLRDQRDRSGANKGSEEERLTEVEENLNQMWVLLRQRRTMRTAGLDPDVVDRPPFLQSDTDPR